LAPILKIFRDSCHYKLQYGDSSSVASRNRCLLQHNPDAKCLRCGSKCDLVVTLRNSRKEILIGENKGPRDAINVKLIADDAEKGSCTVKDCLGELIRGLPNGALEKDTKLLRSYGLRMTGNCSCILPISYF